MKKQQTIKSSFKNAIVGVGYFFLHERNGQIQLVAAILTIVTAVSLGVNVTEWLVILICIALVLGAEMINSAIERLCDVVQEDYHPQVKIIKDGAAAAVLLFASFSVVVGIIIFWKKIF